MAGRADRAEQNRRAQQAFRRRREERMNKLETDAAALEPTQRKLTEAQSQLLETALVCLSCGTVQVSADSAVL
jgi:hypothetical protein